MGDENASLRSRIINTIWNYVEELLKRALQTLAENRPVAFSVAALFFVISCYLGYRSLQRADFYERTVERALSKRTENTPQTYKAIEALILSNAATDAQGQPISFRKLIADANFSPEFSQVIGDLHDILNSKEAHPAHAEFAIARPDIAALIPTRQQEAIVTERNDLGFLFLPVRLLHVSDQHYQEMLQQSGTIARSIGIEESKDHKDGCKLDASEICDDVVSSRRLLSVMKRATTIQVTKRSISGIELVPAQVYYITENGLNRIISRTGNDAIFYRNQFRAATVFPARPYYVGAFLQASPRSLLNEKGQVPDGKLENYFYVSEPYPDIGGNGIVVTLARAVRYADHSEGAICFDLRLARSQALGEKLEHLIDDLEGAHARVNCTTSGSAAPQCGFDGTSIEQLADVPQSLEATLNQARASSSESDVVGAIAFAGSDAEPDQNPVKAGTFEGILAHIAHPKNQMRFTVPLEPPEVIDVEKQTTRLRFLAVSLDVGNYLQRTGVLVFSAIALLGTSILIVVIAWAGDVRNRTILEAQKKNLHLALDNVSKVMLDADTPYIRLDAEDLIVNWNQSFASLFGLSTPEEAIEKLKHTRFEDWISGEAFTREYRRVQQLRRKGLPVKPYTLAFRTVNEEVITARVISSVIPASQDQPEGLPETFGILVPESSVALKRRKEDRVSA